MKRCHAGTVCKEQTEENRFLATKSAFSPRNVPITCKILKKLSLLREIFGFWEAKNETTFLPLFTFFSFLSNTSLTSLSHIVGG